MKLFSSIEGTPMYVKDKNDYNYCKEKEPLMRSVLKGHRGIHEPMLGIRTWDATTDIHVDEFNITESELYDDMCMRIFETYGKYPSTEGVVTINNQTYGSVKEMMRELMEEASKFSIGDKVRLIDGQFIKREELES